MNGIDALIAKGHADALVAAAKPGSTYWAGARGVTFPEDEEKGPADEVRRIFEDFTKAAPEGLRLSIWVCRSPSGKSAVGEIIVDTGEESPAVTWAIGEARGPQLDFLSHRTVTFASASDRLDATGDPCSILSMTNHPKSDRTESMVRALGYRPAMDLGGELNLSFRELNLEPAHA